MGGTIACSLRSAGPFDVSENAGKHGSGPRLGKHRSVGFTARAGLPR